MQNKLHKLVVSIVPSGGTSTLWWITSQIEQHLSIWLKNTPGKYPRITLLLFFLLFLRTWWAIAGYLHCTLRSLYVVCYSFEDWLALDTFLDGYVRYKGAIAHKAKTDWPGPAFSFWARLASLLIHLTGKAEGGSISPQLEGDQSTWPGLMLLYVLSCHLTELSILFKSTVVQSWHNLVVRIST